MATGFPASETPPAASESALPDDAAQDERYIHRQIQKTRRQVKGVEVASSLLILGVGLLVYALLVAVLDSWIVPGGLSIVGRTIAFVLLVLGVGGYVGLRVAPLLARRINPVYAAQAIEQGHPALKNSLINFLLLRGQRARIPAPVYSAIERRAASDLTSVPVDSAVDRSPVIRMGYLLLAAVILFCLYSLLSPKSPLRSFRRVLLPWSHVAAPTRVTIDDVRPGSVRAFVGDSITISALVRGVRTDEPVVLIFTTEDGQSVDQPIEMLVPGDSYRHQAVLPTSGGLQQTLDYRIAAGDAQAGPFHVEVLAAPAILIEQVRYEFPPHTGLAPRIVQHQGDLQGIEGTRVTLRARTNVDMASAYVDLNSDGGRDVELTGDARHVEGSFELRLSPEQKPVYTTYELRFVDRNKQLNPQPIRYRIEVLPDQVPELEITEPGTDNYQLPINGAVTIAVRAADRDFGLRRVSLHFEHASKRLKTIELLDQPQDGPFSGAHVFEPARLVNASLQVGDVVQYWAEARDNRAPTANHVQTAPYRLKIVDPVDDATRDQQLATARQKAEEAAKQVLPPAEETPTEPPAAETSDSTTPDAQPAANDPQEAAARQGEVATADRNDARPDPETDTAEAIERIVSHQQEGDKSSGEPADEQRQPGAEEPPAADQQQDNRDPESGDKSQQPAAKPTPSADQSGQPGQEESGQQSGDSSASKSGSQPGEKSGEAPSGGTPQKRANDGQPAAQDGSADSPADQQQPGGKQSGGETARSQSDKDRQQEPGQSGNPPGGAAGKQQGASQPSRQEQPSGGPEAQPQRDGQPGQQQAKQPGAEKSADQSTADRQTDKQQPGANQPGQRQPDASQPGDGDRTAESGTPESKKPPVKANPSEKTPTGGSRESATGDSGAGQSSKQPNPSPAPQEKNQPRGAKRQQPGGQQPDEKKSDEASSPSISPKQSDSQSGEKGDSSGGGKEGGGQKANQPGTGGPGQNTPSDEGAGTSNEPGAGQTQAGAGDKESDTPTGQKGGKQSGPGSAAKPGSGQSSDANRDAADQQSSQSPPGGASAQPGKAGKASGGSQPGDAAGQSGAPGADGSAPQQSGSPAGNTAEAAPQSDAGQSPGSSAGGGRAGDEADTTEQPFEPSQTSADPLNRQHAQHATELVLETLKEQMAKDAVDPDLLEKLHWSREDMQKFIDRWEQLKRDAAKAGPEGDEARQRLDQVWERLGAERRGLTIRAREGRVDKLRQLREGRVARPPAEYQEQFEAYTEGAARRGGK